MIVTHTLTRATPESTKLVSSCALARSDGVASLMRTEVEWPWRTLAATICLPMWPVPPITSTLLLPLPGSIFLIWILNARLVSVCCRQQGLVVISSGGWNYMLWCSVIKLTISILRRNRLTCFTNTHLPFNYFHLPLSALVRDVTTKPPTQMDLSHMSTIIVLLLHLKSYFWLLFNLVTVASLKKKRAWLYLTFN
jgi:hypothetical protein